MENYRLICRKLPICIVLFVLFIGCHNEKSDFLTERLALIEANTTFSLDSIQLDEWNVCYFIRPYDNVDSLLQELKVSENHSQLIRNNANYNDGAITLLFVRDGSVIDVQTVLRKAMDFTTLPDSINHFYAASKLMINNQREITSITLQE